MKKLMFITLMVAANLTLSSCITTLVAVGIAAKKHQEKEAIEKAKEFETVKANVEHLYTSDKYCDSMGCTQGTNYDTSFRITIIAKEPVTKGCLFYLATDSPYPDLAGRQFTYYVAATLNPEEVFQEELSTARTLYYRVVHEEYYNPIIEKVECE